MGKTVKVFSKAVSLILAMAMVVTCVPTSAYAAELLVDGSEEILLEESTPNVESSDVSISEDVNTSDDSSDAIDTPEVLLSEGDSGNTEERREIDPEKAYKDTEITIKLPAENSHVKFCYVAYDRPQGDEIIDIDFAEGDSYTAMLNSDFGGSFYIVPEVGYEFAAVPVTVSGSYTVDKKTTEFSTSDLDISPISENEEDILSYRRYWLGNSLPIELEGDVATHFCRKENLYVGAFNWSEALKVTVDSGEGSFIKKYVEATDKTPLTVSAVAATPIEYDVPIYTYDKGALSPAKLSKVTLEYGKEYSTTTPDKVDIFGALSAAEWKSGKYTPYLAYVTEPEEKKNWLDIINPSVDTYSFSLNKENNTDWLTIVPYYNADYCVNAQNRSYYTEQDWELAVVIYKGNVDAQYTLTATSDKYATFTKDGEPFTTDPTFDGRSATIYKDSEAVTENIEVQHTHDGKGARKVKGIAYTFAGGEEKELIKDADSWTITKDEKAAPSDLSVKAITSEGVNFIGEHCEVAIKDGEKVGEYTPIVEAVEASAISGKSISFLLSPATEYELVEVTYTKYDIEGEKEVIKAKTLTPDRSGVYEISDITGFVVVNVTTKKVNDTIRVKTKADYSEKVTVSDVRTHKDINNEGDYFAVAGQEYRFAVTEKDGYRLADQDAVTASVGDKPVALTQEGEGVYSFTAPAEGPVDITVNTVEVLKVWCVTNTAAKLSVNGKPLDNNSFVEVAPDEKLTLTATGANGSKVTGIYYDDNGKATSTEGLISVPEDGIITASAVKTWRVTNKKTSMFVYAATESEATEGSYTAAWSWSTMKEGASVVELLAGNNSVTDVGVIFKTEKASVSGSQYKLASEGKTGASVGYSGGTLTSSERYLGGTAPYVEDTLSATGNDNGFPDALVYKASLPIHVLPISSLYEDGVDVFVKSNTAKQAGVAENEVRNKSQDRITLGVGVYNEKAPVGCPTRWSEVSNCTVKYTITPPSSPEAITGHKDYELSEKENNITINKFYKKQTLTANATVTFDDGTSLDASPMDIDVVDNDLGYFAIPTTVVNGAISINGNGSEYSMMRLETSTDRETPINEAAITYDVFHVLSEGGVKYLTDAKELNEQTIAVEIESGVIESVSPEEVTDWELTDYGFFGFGRFGKLEEIVDIEQDDNSFVLTAKKAGTGKFTATAKVGNYTVMCPTYGWLSVDYVLGNNEVTVVTADSEGQEGYQNPVLVDDFGGFRLEEVDDKNVTPVSGIGDYILTGVADGSVLVIPGADAFKPETVDPKRTLAGWKIAGLKKPSSAPGEGSGDAPEQAEVDPIIVPAEGEQYTTLPIDYPGVVVTAIWAPKYQNVVAVDGNTGTALEPGKTTDMAIGTEIPLTVGFNELDATKAPVVKEEGKYSFMYKEFDYIEHDAIASDLTATSTDLVGAPKFKGTKGDSLYTFTGATLTPVGEATQDDVIFTLAWKEDGNAKAAYTVEGNKVAVKNANEWKLAMDPVEIEAGQTASFAVKTLQFNGENVGLTNNETKKIYKVEPKVTTADATIATATIKGNKIEFIGVKEGTTKATLEFTDNLGTAKELTFDVKVNKAKYNIVASLKPEWGNAPLEEEKEVVIADGSTAFLPFGFASELNLSIDKEKDFIGTVDFGVKAIYDEKTESGWVVNGKDKSWTINPNIAFGNADIVVTATLTPESGTSVEYQRVIPAESYGMVWVYGPKDSNIAGVTGDLKENAAFEAYTANAGTKIETGKYSVIPVYAKDYVEKTRKYHVDALSGYSAAWVDTGYAESFEGWVTDKAKVLSGQEEVYVEEGKPIDVFFDNLSAIGLYAAFADSDIVIAGGYNDEIDLDDSAIKGTAGTEGSDCTEIQPRITPAKATATLSVYADKADIIDIKDGSFAKSDLELNKGWDGKEKVSVSKGKEETNYRLDTFKIGKVEGKTGVVNLFLEANGKVADTITVYANGEYEGKDEKTYYMYRGENMKNYSAVVGGEVHYYGADGTRVENGVWTLEDKSLILIVGGAQYTTPGKKEVGEATYYVGKDGKLLTGLFAGIDESPATKDTDKKYYADPETGVMVIDNIVTLESGDTFCFDKNGHQAFASDAANEYEAVKDSKFYVNKEGKAAKGGIFKVDGKNRLFREDGTIVNYNDADVTDGKIVVDGVAYKISEDGTAAADHTEHTWKFDGFVWAADKKSATGSFTCEVGGEQEAAEVTMSSDTRGEGADAITKYTATVEVDPSGKAISESASMYLKADGTEATEKEWDDLKPKPTTGLEIVGLKDEYEYTGTAIKPAFDVVDHDRDDAVLVFKTDYSVKYKNNNPKLKDLGADGVTATIEITGKNNYALADKKVPLTATFKIVNPESKYDKENLATSVKKVDKIAEKFSYDGTAKYPAKIGVTADGVVITMEYDEASGMYINNADGGKQVIVSVENNVNKGTANVYVSGSDGKAKKTTFKIDAVDLSKASAEDLIIEAEEDPVYAVSGATAKLNVTYKDMTLVEGRDYTVKYKYLNKKNAGEKAAEATITGKNNFTKKYPTATPINIANYDLEGEYASVAVAAYAGVAPKSIKVTVFDTAGKAIPAKQYKVTVRDDKGGDITASNVKLAENAEITVTVTPAEGGNLVGEYTKDLTVKAGNLSKAKVTVTKGFNKPYTGYGVLLEEEDFEKSITVTLNGTALKYGDDFEVVAYTNNVKKGTMTVTIQGAEGSEKCSGVKTFKVKIAPKNIKNMKLSEKVGAAVETLLNFFR